MHHHPSHLEQISAPRRYRLHDATGYTRGSLIINYGKRCVLVGLRVSNVGLIRTWSPPGVCSGALMRPWSLLGFGSGDESRSVLMRTLSEDWCEDDSSSRLETTRLKHEQEFN